MAEEKTKYCPSCGAMIEYKYATCPACGKPQPQLPGVEAQQRQPSRRSIWVPTILSLLVTGLGQLYLRRWSRGLLMMFGTLALGFLLDPYITFEQSVGIGVVLGLISAWDAYRIAKSKA